MGRVIFFPVVYFPPDEELKRLEWYQEQYELYHAEIAYISREWSDYQRMIYRERTHRNVREKMKLIKGQRRDENSGDDNE